MQLPSKNAALTSDWKSSLEFRDIFRGKGESEVGSKMMVPPEI